MKKTKGGTGMGRTLALFDFDGTLIPGDSIVSFVRFARKKGVLSRREYAGILCCTVKYLLGGMTDGEMKTRSLRFLRSLPREEGEALAGDFVRSVLMPSVYRDGKAALQKHRDRGDLTVLVSASTDNYMRRAAQALGFDAVLCTELTADFAVESNCKGPEKARRVKEWLAQNGVAADWAASYAYVDSKTAESMLRLCGHPVLVNPRKALKKRMPEGNIVSWR